MFSSLNSNTLNISENTPKLQQFSNSYVPKIHKKITNYVYGAAWSQNYVAEGEVIQNL